MRFFLAAGLVCLLSTFVVAAEPQDTTTGTSIDPGAWVRHPDSAFSITAGETSVSQFRACIDAGACKAETVNTACNYGHADRDAHPVNCVSHDGARQYCAFVEARLCIEDEWLAACRGTDARAFPYGPTFTAEVCNVHSNKPTEPAVLQSTAPVGANRRCEGGLPGLYDMAGNVGEWLDSCKEDYCKFRGGGYLSNDPIDHFTGCGGVCSGNKKSLMSNVVGIRCCRDEKR